VYIGSYDDGDIAPWSRFVRGTIRLPHPEIAEQEFVGRLCEFGRQHSQAVLMPGEDAGLVVASRNRHMLQRYFVVACPDPGLMEKLIDKRLTYTIAESRGVLVPKTFSPRSACEAKEAADAIGYPCLLKPAMSHKYCEVLGVKNRCVRNPENAQTAFLEGQRIGVDMMVQELIAGGDEYGVNYNAYAIDGVPLTEFTARKVRMVPTGGGVPGAVVSEDIKEAVEAGRRTLAAFGFSGFACCEFKWDAKSSLFKLLEVNGRHNRSGLLATKCGINFPLLEYHHLVNGRVPMKLPFAVGRYWVDEFKDISHYPARLRRRPREAVSFWRPYVAHPVFAVLDWHDPLPFVRRAFHFSHSSRNE
jgi:predicted ATP-grasp superfamily ATP-dependent carboligase